MMTVAFGEETVGRTQVLGRISELEMSVTVCDVLQGWNEQ